MSSVYRIHAVDPIGRKILTTWVLPGNVNAATRTAMTNLANATITTSQLLKSEYGADYRKLVGCPDPFGMSGGGPMISGLRGADIETLDVDDDSLVTETSPIYTKVSVEDSTSRLNVTYPGGTVISTDVRVYPEDRLSSLRNKIYLLTGIPPYRQHIFYFDPAGNRVTTYTVYSEEAIPVDIVGDLATTHTEESAVSRDIFGMPIDRTMYAAREHLRVDSIEAFSLVETLDTNDFYVVDLDLFTHASRSQLSQLSSERYQFELLYAGFILKYFPLLTFETFYDYVRNERELYQKYHDLAPSLSYLKHQFAAEASISDRVRTVQKPSLSVGVTLCVVGPTHTPATVDIRNLFDLLTVSPEIPAIRAYVERAPNRYLVTKTLRGTSEIPFPSGWKVGVMICVSLERSDQLSMHRQASSERLERVQNRYGFVAIRPNGKITVRLGFLEESSGDFDFVERVAMGVLNPIIRTVNGFGRRVFGTSRQLSALTHGNVAYESVNLSVYWKRIFSVSMFRTFRSLWERYVTAGIVTMKSAQTADSIDMIWRRGMYQFDPTQIERILVMASTDTEILNHYANLSSAPVHAKWQQIYDGRNVRVHHRATDIRFECIGVRYREFYWLLQYLGLFVGDAARESGLSRPPIDTHSPVKKLRKLREADPELYNLKKHGSPRVYSIICQLPNQPILYTEDEFAALSQKEKSRLVRYWNFTYKRPAYYSCAHGKYPYFSFKTGVHPKGYCLPCCKKTPADDTPARAKIFRACLERQTLDTASDTDPSRHTVSYGKELSPGRISRPPPSLTPLLANTLDHKLSYQLVGVPQGDDGMTSVFYCVAKALLIEPPSLTSHLIAHIRSGVYFDVGLGGSLREYFRDRADLIRTISKIETISPLDTGFRRFDDLVAEIVAARLSTHVIRIEDPDGTGTRGTLLVHDYTRTAARDSRLDRVIVVVRGPSTTYPLVVLDSSYHKTLTPRMGVYTSDSPVLSYILGAILTTLNSPTLLMDLSEVRHLPGYTLVTKYINLHNKCYAVLLSKKNSATPSRHIYVPITPSPHYADGINTQYSGFSGEPSIAYSDVIELLAEVRKQYPQYAPKYVPSSALRVTDGSDPYAILCGDSSVIWYVTEWDEKINLKTVVTGFDPKVVDKLVVSGAPPAEDRRTQLRPQALYRAYAYQLLCVEFSNWVSRLRDRKTRSLILGDLSIHQSRPLRNYYRDVLSRLDSVQIDPDSRRHILGLILSVYANPKTTVGEFLELFENTQYEFDRREVLSLSSATLPSVLRKLVVTDNRTPDLSNVFVACASDEGASHCSKGRLIMSERDLTRFSSVLASDLHNPFLRRGLLTGVSSVGTVDFLKFQSSPDALIRIERVV